MRKGLRQAKKEKNYEKALQFAAGLESEGKAYGMGGSAADTTSLAQGRVASREALADQMRSQTPALTGQTREAKIAAAKSAGTFESTRQKYNADAKSSGKTMDEAGNITDLPKETPPAAATPSKAAPLSPRLKLANALNEGRIKVGSDEEANRLVQSASDGTTPLVADKKKETQVKRDRLLAKGRAMPSRTA
jgi:hypothetical protein